jgi:polyferredoxin
MFKAGIFFFPAGRWCKLSGCLLTVLMMLVICGNALAEEAAFDPGKATGPEIQAFRDQWVPQEYPSPARAWFYADVAAVAGLLLNGAWLVRAHRPARWISAQLALALIYFGIIRGGCICPVGATANVLLGISHPELVGLATLALFLTPLIAALASGRIFCGSVCPLGAVQQLLSRNNARPLPRWLHRSLLALPVVVLLATGVFVWTGLGFLPCQLDPYTPIFFQGHAFLQKLTALLSLRHVEAGWILAGSSLAWTILAVALIAGWFIPRIFCRYACPYSVLLGLLAAVGFWRRKIDADACIQCRRCVKQCPVQAIQPAADGKTFKLSSYQCVQCGICSGVCKQQAV